MANPQNFISNTDYAAPANDGLTTVTLTIPNGESIPSFGSTTWSIQFALGKKNANLRAQMQTSLRLGEWTPGNTRFIDMTLDYAGAISTETGAVSIERVTPTMLRLYCTHFNTAPFAVTVVGGQTITANVATFLSPFN